VTATGCSLTTETPLAVGELHTDERLTDLQLVDGSLLLVVSHFSTWSRKCHSDLMQL